MKSPDEDLPQDTQQEQSSAKGEGFMTAQLIMDPPASGYFGTGMAPPHRITLTSLQGRAEGCWLLLEGVCMVENVSHPCWIAGTCYSESYIGMKPDSGKAIHSWTRLLGFDQQPRHRNAQEFVFSSEALKRQPRLNDELK